MQIAIVLKTLVYVLPGRLKLAVCSSKLVLVGEYGRALLQELEFATFVKRARLVLCSRSIRYAIAKLANAVKGALYGHIRWLRLNGIGYKALLNSNGLELSLGFSHKLMFRLPRSVEVDCLKPISLGLRAQI